MWFLQGVRAPGSFLSSERCWRLGLPIGLWLWGSPSSMELCRALPCRVSRREEGFWAHPCSSTSCVWPSLVESLRCRPTSSLPLPRSTALSAEVLEGAWVREGGRCAQPRHPRGFSQQETHWGETL